MESEPPFRILTVCTGNICRSPMAERLLQAGLDDLEPGRFVVESAGTGALAGSAMDPHVEGLTHVMGGRTDGFIARQLTEDILFNPDLVIAMTRAHRSAVVELAPSLVRRTFTLRELARILPGVQGLTGVSVRERWKHAMQVAARARTQTGQLDKDDITDPYRRAPEIYQQMTRELVPAVQAVLDWEYRHHEAGRPR